MHSSIHFIWMDKGLCCDIVFLISFDQTGLMTVKRGRHGFSRTKTSWDQSGRCGTSGSLLCRGCGYLVQTSMWTRCWLVSITLYCITLFDSDKIDCYQLSQKSRMLKFICVLSVHRISCEMSLQAVHAFKAWQVTFFFIISSLPYIGFIIFSLYLVGLIIFWN